LEVDSNRWVIDWNLHELPRISSSGELLSVGITDARTQFSKVAVEVSDLSAQDGGL
jgi:hypothetical protein